MINLMKYKLYLPRGHDTHNYSKCLLLCQLYNSTAIVAILIKLLTQL